MFRPRLLRLIDTAYTIFSRSRRLVLVAVVLRRALAELIGHRLSTGGIDPELNGEAWFLRQIAGSGKTYVDVGANVGQWTGLALDASPEARVVAYEPGNTAQGRLRARFGDDPRVEIVPAAVADVPGHMLFYEESNAGETSSLIAEHSNADTTARTVSVVTIDDELDRLGITNVDVLKVDAEGFDLHVLRGATRALREERIAAVQFEYNSPWALAGGTLGAAERLFRECGMLLFVLRDGELRTFDYPVIGELFTYANFVALRQTRLRDLAIRVGGDALA